MNSPSAKLHPSRQSLQFLALSLPFFGIVVGSAALGEGKKKSRRGVWIALVLVLALSLVLAGCGGGGSSPSAGAPAGGSYPVTITGASGALQQSTSIMLSVQN